MPFVHHPEEMKEELEYVSGYGNELSSEAVPNTLPSRNNPLGVPHGLYAEQLSCSAFTSARTDRFRFKRTWMYRIRPCVTHEPFRRSAEMGLVNEKLLGEFTRESERLGACPNQMRWRPTSSSSSSSSPSSSSKLASVVDGSGSGSMEEKDWVESLTTVCGSGSAAEKRGYAVHVYAFGRNMHMKQDEAEGNGDGMTRSRCIADCDGEMLIVPQNGSLRVTTECGVLRVDPGEIVILPRGLRFAIDKWKTTTQEASGEVAPSLHRGYVLEVFEGSFCLPDLGVIGANGLASARDFLAPVASYEDEESLTPDYEVVHKYCGSLWSARQTFSPFNVVAWHGTALPFKYDLDQFAAMNAVRFDHPDPSIFTVLTVPGHSSGPRPGESIADFVVFPPRWSVAEDTFRPPYYHRNCMNEFMGLVRGVYEAKLDDGGFVPGGCSLHSCMTPHGPDVDCYEKSIAAEKRNQPEHLPRDTLAFMFEMSAMPLLTRWAMDGQCCLEVDKDYYKCWTNLKRRFVNPPFMSNFTAPPTLPSES